jgi:hypothetical protein
LGRDLMLVRRRPTRQPADRRARGKRWGEAGRADWPGSARAERTEMCRQGDRRRADKRDEREGGRLTVRRTRGRGGRSAMQCNGEGEGEGEGEAGGLGEWSS